MLSHAIIGQEQGYVAVSLHNCPVLHKYYTTFPSTVAETKTYLY